MPRTDPRSYSGDQDSGSNYQPTSGRNSGGNTSGMNRNPHQGFGGTEAAQGRGTSMSENPNMDAYGAPTGRSAGRMPAGMGHNGPHTPMGGGFPESGSPSGAGGAMNPNLAGMGAYGGGPMDGGMGHPSMMPGGPNFEMRGPGGMGNFAGAPGEMEARNMMQRRAAGGRSGAGSGAQSATGAPAGSAAPGQSRPGLTQAEREEELLLNLLIARRQRGRTGGQEGPALRDELMRLRQQQGGSGGAMDAAMGAFGATGGGGAMQAGVPSMYDPGMGNGAGGASNAFPPGDAGDQRIDRTPHYMMDARTQEALMRQGMGGSGSKRGAPNMAYDPSGFGAGNQLKYPPYNMMPHPHAAMGHPQGVHPMHGAGAMGGAGGAAMGGGMPPPQKKRRSHKKKPADMPRRPLSAYNLFFSEERERILKEISEKEGGGEAKEEGKDQDEEQEGTKSDEDKDDKKEEKPKALLRPLIPNQKQRRPHRKTHGKISFQQLARMVGERWKALPDDKRKYYQNLAQEDMKRQKEAMEEYYARQQAVKHGGALDKPPQPEEDEEHLKDAQVKAEI
eukprot:CAMPEP_0172455676 /NCGR_PEP_ID=MMETSP1065-20121228/12188_1 /TAXON_ID=265537 /ORGANISM="Amphiprora paludosa, Strain CCMP125" /LENGTH=559 /DNA_ID=CAMNT_0013208145 /DNA_START=163 /DNA_END=1842 /DNA_ORIENTATION=+